MAEKRLAWSGSPYSVLSFVLRRNQDQETRLCKTDYRLTVRTVQPIQFRVSLLPAAVRRGAAIATNHWLGSGGGALGSGLLGSVASKVHTVRIRAWQLNRAATSLSIVAGCVETVDAVLSLPGSSLVPLSARRSQQHGVCRMMEYITSKW
jgi:hypothetical protein